MCVLMQWPHLVFNITCKILTPALFFICNLCNCCSFLYAQKIISFIFPDMLCMKSFLLHFAKEKGDQHSFISFSLSLYEHASLDSMSSLYHWYISSLYTLLQEVCKEWTLENDTAMGLWDALLSRTRHCDWKVLFSLPGASDKDALCLTVVFKM